MDDGRDDRPRRLGVMAGRIGLLVVAAGTTWGAMVAGGAGHTEGAVLVAAPVVETVNAQPSSTPTAPPRLVPPVSRARVRTPLVLPTRVPARATGRHIAR